MDRSLQIRHEPSVLLVEDDAGSARALSALLASRSIGADVARTAPEAVGLLASRSYRVVISDLDLGDRDGTPFLRWLRETHPETEVIALSAVDEGQMRRGLSGLALRACLQKPVDPAQLFDLLESLLAA